MISEGNFGNRSTKAKIMFVIPQSKGPQESHCHHLSLPLRNKKPLLQDPNSSDTNKNMSISSSLFGSRITLVSNISTKTNPVGGMYNGGLVIENSSRPKKKATAHHMKTRPRKTQAWDIRRKPTVYAPLPPLPPDWTLVSHNDNDAGDAGAEATVPSPPALQAPLASG